MGRLLISWLINAIALALAAYFVPGIQVTGDEAWIAIAVMAIIFGLVNALIRPLVKFLTCLINVFTLGLFTLVINALMLMLSGWIAGQLDIGFQVEGFIPAFLGALLISVVSFVSSIILKDDDRSRRRRTESRRDRW
ncbi:MAG: phage holin family protein [Anaerolineae bacterium]